MERFQLTGVSETGKELGKGSYAIVVELNFRGLKCAGKKLHGQLCNVSSQAPSDREGVLRRFEAECQLLERLRHPNVVQFLGVYVDRTLPVLVMEFMHRTLSDCIQCHGRLPDELSYGILADVATGLCFLHSSFPAVVHRDLSANNILLTPDVRAKISDLGVARILDLTPLQMTKLTTCPGTPCYMPPEALAACPVYTTSIDTFSYGVMLVHVFSGQWPIPETATRVSASGPEVVEGLTEVQRRQRYLNMLGKDHALLALIKQCLSNRPSSRPTAEQIHHHVCSVALQSQQTFEDKLDCLRQHHLGLAEQKRLQSELGQVRRVVENNKIIHNSETAEIRMQLSGLQREKENLAKQLEATDKALRAKEIDCATQLEVNARQFRAKETALRTEYEAKYQQVSISLWAKEKELVERRQEVKVLESAIDTLVVAKEEEINARDIVTASKVELLENREKQISDLHSQLTQLRQSVGLPQLEFTECSGLPLAMHGAQCLLLNGLVYMGGGVTTNEEFRYTVFQYDPKSDNWSLLPNCPAKYFGLTLYEGRLYIVGGTTSDHTAASADLYAYNSCEQKWTKSTVPSMPSKRYFVTAVASEACIAVCGGLDENKHSLTTVEVFRGSVDDASCGQWYSSPSLPHPCFNMKVAVSGSKCYLLGGFENSSKASQSLVSISLDQLFSSTVRPQSANSLTASVDSSSEANSAACTPWKVVAECPFKQSTVAGFAGTLLAIGGFREEPRNSTTNAVYSFSEATQTWTKLDSFSANLYSSMALTLEGGSVLVAGGLDSSKTKMHRAWTLSLTL